MTIAEVNVTFKLAFPQGLTHDEIREHIVEMLAEHITPEPNVVEFDVNEILVNADPFGKDFQWRITSTMGPKISTVLQQPTLTNAPVGAPFDRW